MKQMDINFKLRVNSLALATNIETPLYETDYNMFIDMVSSSITQRN